MLGLQDDPIRQMNEDLVEGNPLRVRLLGDITETDFSY